jgi:hypothetical protein
MREGPQMAAHRLNHIKTTPVNADSPEQVNGSITQLPIKRINNSFAQDIKYYATPKKP